MINTGIRSGTEVRNIRWRDVECVEENEKKYVRIQVSNVGKKTQKKCSRTIHRKNSIGTTSGNSDRQLGSK